MYRSQAHYQTVALRKPAVAAHRCFDCLFAAASITVGRCPINQAAALTHNGNYLYHSGHFLPTAAGFRPIIAVAAAAPANINERAQFFCIRGAGGRQIVAEEIKGRMSC